MGSGDKMSEAGRERLSARVIKAVWGLRGGAGGESFEQRLDRLQALLGDGSGLLEKESLEEFASAFEPEEGPEILGEGTAVGAKNRVALENVLAALEPEEDGEAWKIGLLALARCGVLDNASERVAGEAFRQMKDAMFYETPHPWRLARECFERPAYARCAKKGKAGERVCEFFEGMLFNAVHEKRQSMREGAKRTLGALLDALEKSVELRDCDKGPLPGEALRRLVEFDDARLGDNGEKINAWLHERAREWIKKGIDKPESGELAAWLCASLEQALRSRSEAGGKEALWSLRVALEEGAGARVRAGDQPLKILSRIHPRGLGALSLIAEEAAQALLEAGASERDLLDDLERALSEAPHQGVIARVRAKMERSQIQQSLSELSPEEEALVKAHRQSRREEAGEELGRRRPAL